MDSPDNNHRNGKNGSVRNPSEETFVAYRERLGTMYCGSAEATLKSPALKRHRGKVQLLFTSPPFPLNTKKRYGNKKGEEYVKWLASLAPMFADCLTDDGSIVLEIGNGWVAGEPVMSTLTLRALLAFLDEGKLQLCQQFVVYNPARLPSPAQWVNVKRIRVKDAFTHVWWMARTSQPKADNRRVLTDYSKSMRKLLSRQKYNSGKRPSQHNIGKESFLADNAGAIPSNVITLSNTSSSDEYLEYCRSQKLDLHPARMPAGLPAFFINFLTEPGDLVLDPFAGSNTTGAVAQALGRRWLGVEMNIAYIAGSRGRFPQQDSVIRA